MSKSSLQRSTGWKNRIIQFKRKTKSAEGSVDFSNRIKEGSESNEYQTRAGKTELDSVGKGKDYERKYIDRMGK